MTERNEHSLDHDEDNKYQHDPLISLVSQDLSADLT
jgi:hypothetical protein